jgi:RPA family protein
MEEKVEYLFAGELDRSDLVVPGGGGRGADRPALVTPTGLVPRRLSVVGALTEIEGKGGDYLHARVADPTGAFSLSSGWHRPEVTGALAKIEPPAFISVTASPVISSRSPGRGVVLFPEAVAVVDRLARDTWVIATAEATLGRLERLGAALSGGVQDPVLSQAIAHYRITPSFLGEMADLIDAALASVTPAPKAGTGAPKADPVPLVLAFLAARPKEAVPVEEVLAELGRHGIGAEEATRAVKELLDEGECYAPRKGTLRLA